MNEIPNLNAGRRSLIGRFFGWLTSRRIMRRIVIGFACFITVIAAFWVWLNWREKRELEICKRDLAAKGEVLAWSAYYPPDKVPDDQNMFKAPMIAKWFASTFDGSTVTNEFARRLFNPATTSEITTKAAATEYLMWSDRFQSDFDTLAAALKRPYAMMDVNLATGAVPNRVAAVAVARTLAQRAKCHLLLGQTESTLEEWNLIHSMKPLLEGRSTGHAPAAAASRDVGEISLEVVARGLELRAWQEPQLLALQNRLKESDFISPLQSSLRLARSWMCLAYETIAQQGRSPSSVKLNRARSFLADILPRGLIYKLEARKIAGFQSAIDVFSLANDRANPADLNRKMPFRDHEISNHWWPQNGIPALRTQTRFIEAQTACALERYRLAHGEYPEALDALVPQFIEQLPHSIVNGETLSYRRTAEGSFLLSAAGWNGTDEDEQTSSSAHHLNDLRKPREFLQEVDWVWTNQGFGRTSR